MDNLVLAANLIHRGARTEATNHFGLSLHFYAQVFPGREATLRQKVAALTERSVGQPSNADQYGCTLVSTLSPTERSLLLGTSVTALGTTTRERHSTTGRRGSTAGRTGGGASGRFDDGLASPSADKPQTFTDSQTPTPTLGKIIEFFETTVMGSEEAELKTLQEEIPSMLQDARLFTLSVTAQTPSPPVKLPTWAVFAIFLYTYESDIYKKVNYHMRTRNKHFVDFFQPYITALISAIRLIPCSASSGPAMLFRGISLGRSVQLVDQYCPDQFVTWNQFSSSTTSRAVAQDFMQGSNGIMFIIHSHTAAPIAFLSDFPNEEEVLFTPSQFRVVDLYLQNYRNLYTDHRRALPLSEAKALLATGVGLIIEMEEVV